MTQDISLDISVFLSQENFCHWAQTLGKGGEKMLPSGSKRCRVLTCYTKIMFGLELKHIKALIEVTSWSSRTYHGGGNSPKTT